MPTSQEAMHETMTDAARRGQEDFTSALQIWADSVPWFVPWFAPISDAKLRSTVHLVDRTFDYWDHVLECNREYTKSLLAVTTSAAHKVASATQNAAKEMQGVVRETAPKRDTQDGAKEAALKRG